MGEILNFNRIFVERSKEVLLNNWDDLVKQGLEVTTVLNFTISLLCIIEDSLKNDYKAELFQDFLKAKSCYVKFAPFNLCESDITFSEQKILTELVNLSSISDFDAIIFLKKLRNSFAHRNIKAINSNGIWDGIRIWNRKMWGDKDIDFVFEIDALSLLKLYSNLADIHIASTMR